MLFQRNLTRRQQTKFITNHNNLVFIFCDFFYQFHEFLLFLLKFRISKSSFIYAGEVLGAQQVADYLLMAIYDAFNGKLLDNNTVSRRTKQYYLIINKCQYVTNLFLLTRTRDKNKALK